MGQWRTSVSHDVEFAVHNAAEQSSDAAIAALAACDVGSYDDVVFALQALARVGASAAAREQSALADRTAAAAAQLAAAATAALGAEDLLIGCARHFRETVGTSAALSLLDAAGTLAGGCFTEQRFASQSARLVNLSGEILRELGEWEAATQQYEWALEMLATSGEDVDAMVGAVCNNLGLVLLARGDRDGARRELLRSLELTGTEPTLERAYALDNLGSIELQSGLSFLGAVTADGLRAGGTLRVADGYFAAAQEIFRRELPEAADDLVLSLEQRADVAHALEDRQRWRDLAAEASGLLGPGLSADAMWRAALLNAQLAAQDGRPEIAAQVIFSTWNAVLPHGASSEHLGGLELLLALAADQGLGDAVSAAVTAIVYIEDESLPTLLSRGSERETAEAFLHYTRRMTRMLGVLLSPDDDLAVDPGVYEIVLNRKGLLGERRGHAWLRSHTVAAAKDEIAAVRRLRAAAARADLEGGGDGSVYEARLNRERIGRELDRAESRLTQALAAEGAPAFTMRGLDELRAALADNETFVDVVAVAPIDGPGEYAAFLIRADPDIPVQMLRLGAAEDVDDALRALLANGRAAASSASAPQAAPLVRLCDCLGSYRVVFSPTGAWGAVPLALLRGSDGLPLIDSHVVTTVPSARWLIAHRADGMRREPAGPPLVLGDPDFDLGVVDDLEFFLRWRVDPLPYSRTEATVIAELLGVAPVLGRDVTRARLLGTRRPRVLHVASHGDFLDARHSLRELSEPREYRLRASNGVVVMEDSREVSMPRRDAGDHDSAVARHRARVEWLREIGPSNPATRSALLLAGFNAWVAGAELGGEFGAGLITAGELAMMDLSSTDLVVLSACESGVGAEDNADGIQLGLHADALAAGAAMCISSLWNVRDDVTAELMEELYRHYVNELAPADALRLAQLEVRSRHPEPYFWAGWLAQGA